MQIHGYLEKGELAPLWWKLVAELGGELMGDKVLAAIAHDLIEANRRTVTIDWTQKEAVCAKMRRRVERLLQKHGYPPDKREEAVIAVLEQAEQVCRDWAGAA